jgi:hypothetical protein
MAQQRRRQQRDARRQPRRADYEPRGYEVEDQRSRSEWTDDDERRFPSQQEYGDRRFGYGQRGWEEQRERRSQGRYGYGQEEGDREQSRFGEPYGNEFREPYGGDLRPQGGEWQRFGQRGFEGYGGTGSGADFAGYGRSGRREEPGRFGAGGGYAGRGPKGYRRSDERIIEDVCQALEDDDEVDASNIEVACQASEIVLRGSVPERRMKRLAEDVAESLPGVKDVRNELRVAHEAEAKEARGAQSREGGRHSTTS